METMGLGGGRLRIDIGFEFEGRRMFEEIVVGDC